MYGTVPEQPIDPSPTVMGLGSVRSQGRTLGSVLLLAYAAALLGLYAISWTASNIGVPVSDFTRDPASVAGTPFYTGLLSNLGILLWCATAAVTLFGSALLDKQGQRRAWISFLRFSGLFTAILLLDDLFLLHEFVFPVLLGVREGFVLLGYGMLMLVYLGIFRREILRTEFLVLVLAGGFFAGSIVVDRCPEDWISDHHLFEDGSKFLGIVTWFLYFSRTTHSLVRRAADGG